MTAASIYATTSTDLTYSEAEDAEGRYFRTNRYSDDRLVPQPPDHYGSWRIISTAANNERIFWTWEKMA